MGNKKGGVCFQYGKWVTKVMEHTIFNFGEEYYKEDVTKIRKSILTTMRFEIINGKVTENLSLNKKKRK